VATPEQSTSISKFYKDKTPHLLNVYCEMGLFTVNIGLKNNTLSQDRADEIKSLLKGVSDE